jgi:hypothetical protein
MSGRDTPTNVGGPPRTFSGPNSYAMLPVPDVKNEPQGPYGGPNMQGITATGQPFAAASEQTGYTSFNGTQGVYPVPQMAYNLAQYGTASAHPKQQLSSAPLGSSMAYSTPSGIPYYPAPDGGTAPPTTTPAIDWMRWTQANLNPFVQHAQQDYMPAAATTLMSMGDSRASVSGAPGPTPEHNTQWPLNYYNGGQFATSHPG